MSAMHAERERRVGLVGSSGGGAATLGHADAEGLRAAIAEQLASIRGAGVKLVAAVFVSCEVPLDRADPDAAASLWALGEGSRLQRTFTGRLEDVNACARSLDADLAREVREQKLHGVIAISADVGRGGVNRASLTAAGSAAVPVTGTGGTSLSIAAGELGCQLVGNAGGSVATTPQSKAIGIAAAFAGAWRMNYSPACSDTHSSMHSTLDGSLPAFLAGACFATAIRKLPLSRVVWPYGPYLYSIGEALQGGVLAPAVGAIAAQQASQAAGLGEIAVLGGALVGGLSRGSAFCALLAGTGLARVAPHLLAVCARFSVPATASTIVVAGAVPVLMGTCAHALAPKATAASTAVRHVIAATLRPASQRHPLYRPCANAAAGLLMNYGSRHGWYHSIFLPLILLEMEFGSMSALGALDWLTLCMTGAGACAAQLVVPHPDAIGDRSLARRGLAYNLLFGDYIEACFPFLHRDGCLDLAVYVASAASAALANGAQSTAYLPAPLAVALGDAPLRLSLASVMAFSVPFLAGMASNAVRLRQGPCRKQKSVE